MTLDYSWESLTRPGEATVYFAISNPAPLQINSNNFNISNAWWLAEISRLIYHDNFYNDKNIDLGSFQYEKVGYINNKNTSTQAALLKVIQDSPCLVIVFRGTDEIYDWNTNAHAYQMAFGEAGKVHNGFKKAYISIREELFEHIKDNALPVFITGHSLGAALATLAASELYRNKHFDSCYAFGSPRIGNPEFIDSIKCEQIYRVINNSDIVTTIPIDFTRTKYKHIGFPYLIDDKGELLEGMSEIEIYAYQKSKLQGLKEYAVLKIFNRDSKPFREDLPAFLADHAPVNYVLGMQKLIKV